MRGMTSGRPARARRGPLTRGLSAAAAALALLAALPGAAQEFDFTMGVITSPGDVYTALTRSIPERVSEATDGRVAITVSDSLVAPAQIASAVRDGRLPMSAALHTYLAAEEPRMGIFNLPGLIDDIEEYQQVRDAFWAEDVAGIWREKWNAVVLAEGAWCPTRLFSKEPIHTLEDFEGKRLRVHNPQTAALMEVLGAQPTPMTMTEIMPALQRGVIDGLFTSVCVGGAFEFPRVAPNVQDWGIGPITGWAILINADVWEELPDDIREQMQGAMADLEKEAFGSYNDYVEQALAGIEAFGVTPWTAPEEERARVNEPQYADVAYESWYARADELGIDGPAYVERVREVLGKQ
jgi:TRAP-type C4-dicarboxylate transport system substrate-binding protein